MADLLAKNARKYCNMGGESCIFNTLPLICINDYFIDTSFDHSDTQDQCNEAMPMNNTCDVTLREANSFAASRF